VPSRAHGGRRGSSRKRPMRSLVAPRSGLAAPADKGLRNAVKTESPVTKALVGKRGSIGRSGSAKGTAVDQARSLALTARNDTALSAMERAESAGRDGRSNGLSRPRASVSSKGGLRP
jgi:hypothetical protein